jgi:hypothetical protein
MPQSPLEQKIARLRATAQAVNCNYCEQEAELVTGADMYPHRRELAHLLIWRCVSCDASVGCHEGTTIPYGTLANAETKFARQRAHRAFDQLWLPSPTERISKVEVKKRRNCAYWWLSHQMGSPDHQIHIGKMNADECDQVQLHVYQKKPTPQTIKAWMAATMAAKRASVVGDIFHFCWECNQFAIYLTDIPHNAGGSCWVCPVCGDQHEGPDPGDGDDPF